MKKLSKAGYVALVLSSVLTLSACGSEEKAISKTGASLDKDHVFSQKDMSELLEQIEISEIDNIYISDGYLFMKGSYYGDEYCAYNRFGSIKLDGTDAKVFQASEDDIYYYDDEDFEDGEIPVEILEREEGLAEDGLERPHEEELVNEDAISEEEQQLDDVSDASDEEAAVLDVSEEDIFEEEYEEGYDYSYVDYVNMVAYNGNFLVLKHDYSESNENDDFVITEKYSIISFDRDGNVINEHSLSGTDEDAEADNNAYISNFQVTEEGNIFFVKNDNEIVMLDASFNKVNSKKVEDVVYIFDFYVTGDSVVYRGWDEDYENQKIFRLNMKTNEVENFEFPAILSNGTAFPGSDGVDLYIATEKEIYAWNLNSTEVVEVLDFIDSDVDISYVDGFCAMSESDFIILYTDTGSYESQLAEFVKVDPEKVADKKVITLACKDLDYTIKSQVIDFNKKNENYRIQIMDYSAYDTYDDYNAGITKLNNDIATGKIPDIMLLNSRMPITSYNEKGLFADLKEFVDKDSDLSMDQFAPNLVNAFSNDGKWYSIVPSFSVVTYGAKESLVGEKENWTVKDALELWEQYPDAMLIDDGTKDGVLSEGLYCMGNQFVDWKTGNCKFNSDEFIALLEFANKFPKDLDYSDEYWDEYFATYETMYRDNKILTQYLYISSISSLNYQEQGSMGEKMTFVGFPTENGVGTYIVPDNMISITAKSGAKEGAWEFVRYYLSSDYDCGKTLTIRMDKLQEQVKEATQRPYFENEDGTKEEYDDYYYIGDKEIIINPMSEERANEILAFILSVENTSFYDEDLFVLISEEADSFFSGQKSAKEVADIIQSRAQIYVNEHM